MVRTDVWIVKGENQAGSIGMERWRLGGALPSLLGRKALRQCVGELLTLSSYDFLMEVYRFRQMSQAAPGDVAVLRVDYRICQ